MMDFPLACVVTPDPHIARTGSRIGAENQTSSRAGVRASCDVTDLYELDGDLVNALFGRLDRLLAFVQRVELRVVLVELGRAPPQQVLDVLLVLDHRLAELCDLVVSVLVECAQHADARFTRLTVESHLHNIHIA